jgi:hypothetical protein
MTIFDRVPERPSAAGRSLSRRTDCAENSLREVMAMDSHLMPKAAFRTMDA